MATFPQLQLSRKAPEFLHVKIFRAADNSGNEIDPVNLLPKSLQVTAEVLPCLVTVHPLPAAMNVASYPLTLSIALLMVQAEV